MATVKTTLVPRYKKVDVKVGSDVKVILEMTDAEAEELLIVLRRYYDGKGKRWDGPTMTKLARAVGRRPIPVPIGAYMDF